MFKHRLFLLYICINYIQKKKGIYHRHYFAFFFKVKKEKEKRQKQNINTYILTYYQNI